MTLHVYNLRSSAPRHAVLVLLLFALSGPIETRTFAQSLAERLRAETVEQLVADARGEGNAVRGAILFTQQELSCTRCHVPAAENPIAPDLTRLSDDVTETSLLWSICSSRRTTCPRWSFRSSTMPR